MPMHCTSANVVRLPRFFSGGFLRLLVWTSVLASAIFARADYPLRVSSNLVNWQALFMTSPAAMPVSFINANRAAARFPRVQLGP